MMNVGRQRAILELTYWTIKGWWSRKKLCLKMRAKIGLIFDFLLFHKFIDNYFQIIKLFKIITFKWKNIQKTTLLNPSHRFRRNTSPQILLQSIPGGPVNLLIHPGIWLQRAKTSYCPKLTHNIRLLSLPFSLQKGTRRKLLNFSITAQQLYKPTFEDISRGNITRNFCPFIDDFELS